MFTQEMFVSLANAGWKFTPFEESEQGRCAALAKRTALLRLDKLVNPCAAKVTACALTALAGLIEPLFFVFSGFFGTFAVKSLYRYKKLQRQIDAIYSLKTQLHYLYEVRKVIYHQNYTLMLSRSQTKTKKIAQQIAKAWLSFPNMLVKEFPIDVVEPFIKQKKAIICHLSTLQIASANPKVKRKVSGSLQSIAEVGSNQGPLAALILDLQRSIERLQMAVESSPSLQVMERRLMQSFDP